MHFQSISYNFNNTKTHTDAIFTLNYDPKMNEIVICTRYDVPYNLRNITFDK